MIYVYTSHYPEAHAKRREELDYCLGKMAANRLIDKLVILQEPPYDAISVMNAEIVRIPERPTFADFFAVANARDKDDLHILTNSDIWIDERNIGKIVGRAKGRTFLALTRWDVTDPNDQGTLWNCKDSQDTWAWKGKNDVPGKYRLGKPGCDNHLAWEAAQEGWNVINPSLSIKTYHVHQSQIRHYTRFDIDLVRGPYRSVEITR